MSGEKVEIAPVSAAEHRARFFRQSGWLMIANIAGGALMWGVHFLSKRLKEGEYGTFVTLLSLVMCLPVMPLQMVLAQQTAKALATRREPELAGMIRMIWLGTFGLWLVGSAVVLFQQDSILHRWGITNPLGLWITLVICLFSTWLPLFSGVLQGQQNFLWLGWTMMINGVGRLAVAAVAVFALGGYAAGMMSGVLLGVVVAAGLAMWQSYSLWRLPAVRFDWRRLLAQVIPLMLGFAAFQFLFTADTMFIKAYFTAEETDAYGGAGTLSRALMWLVGPLAAVMFPRIVHSAARSEKTDLLRTVLLGTLLLSVGGALGLWVLGPFVVKVVYPAKFVTTAVAVLPWYAFAMVPLALANVLLNNLLARGSFRIVPSLVVLAVAYGFALTKFHGSLITVLQVLCGFNLLLLAVCVWFTYRGQPAESQIAQPVT